MGEFNFKQKNFLGVNDIWKDIKELSKFFKIIMIVGMFIIIFFNFFDVQKGQVGHDSFFIPINQYNSVIDTNSGVISIFGHNESGAMAVAILYSLNGIAAFTGLLSVAMIVNAKTSQYFWGILNALFFGMFALSVGYIGDFLMNIILFLGAPVGWYLMEIKGLKNKESKSASWKFNIIFYSGLAVVAFFVIMMWYWAIPEASKTLFNQNPYAANSEEVKGGTLRWLDGITNGLNTTGYIMQLGNMDQQFYVWFFVNISKILKFTSLAGKQTLNINMLIQFSVWFTMALIGLYKRNLESIVNNLIATKKQNNRAKKAY